MFTRRKKIILSVCLSVVAVIVISLILYFSLKKSDSMTPENQPEIKPDDPYDPDDPKPSQNSQQRGINLEDQTVLNIDPFKNSPENNLPISWPYVNLYENKPNTYRTFSFSGKQNQNWVKYLILNDFFVMIGLDLSNNSEDIDELVEFYADNKIKMEKFLIAISVANEPFVSEINQIKTKIKVIRDLITQKKLMDIPITCVVSLTENETQQWIVPGTSYPPKSCRFSEFYVDLLSDLDIIAFNCYGGFFSQRSLTEELSFDVALSESISWIPGNSILINQFSALRSAMKAVNLPTNKRLWITETGWSSSQLLRNGEVIRDQDGVPQTTPEWSNQANQLTFYRNFLNFDMQTNMKFTIDDFDYNFEPPEKIFFFCLRDSFLARENISEFFGLFLENLNSLQEK
jgi:hypothetical protein